MHVNWLGLTSEPDWVLMRRAVNDEYVLVTSNSTDFRKLAEREELHAGIICLTVAHRDMYPNELEQMFEHALDQLAEGEPVNEVLELTKFRNGQIQVRRYEWPTDPS